MQTILKLKKPKNKNNGRTIKYACFYEGKNMKHFLISKDKKQYISNLHCHTTLSDGRRTPEEIRDAYKAQGYSVVAFSDHDNYFDHSDFCTDDFVAINSFEADISDNVVKSSSFRRCYHLNAFNIKGDKHVDLPPTPDYRDKKAINEYVASLRQLGFIVMYNHPYWSMQTREDYIDLKGCDIVEVYNNSVFIEGGDNGQEHVYDEMLRKGQKLYCVMADDNHNEFPFGDVRCDSFGGKTVFIADSLSYESIMSAMISGSFYCTMRPEIYELTFENGNVHIECSDAARIAVSTAGRQTKCLHAKPGESVTQADFTVSEDDIYFRIEVLGHDGKRADTNAYFMADYK